MKIDVRAASGIAAALVGAGVAVGVIAMSGHPAPAPVVIQPAAAVASTTTHASTPKAAQPAAVKPAVKKPALVQEATVTDPSTATAPSGPATYQTSPDPSSYVLSSISNGAPQSMPPVPSVIRASSPPPPPPAPTSAAPTS